jgi:hypothetical protein
MNPLRTLSIAAGVAASLALIGCPPTPSSSPPKGEATGAGAMHDPGAAGQGTMHDRGSGSEQGMMNGQGSTGPSGAPMPHGGPPPSDAK